MKKLTTSEKYQFEKLFEMDSGYVMDFSNRTFQEFILDSVDIDIYNDKYNYQSGSKANRLRAFWDRESNHLVGKLLADLLEYWNMRKTSQGEHIPSGDVIFFQNCIDVAERLKQDQIIENLEDIEFSTLDEVRPLINSLRESINRNEPEATLDRLHTLVVKYVKHLCSKHDIPYDNKVSLHGLFGGYVKYLRDNNLLQATMTARILGNSIHLLEEFNHVRNNQSLAHDSILLNKSESILIFNNVIGILRFVDDIEKDKFHDNNDETDFEDIPF